MRPIDADRLKSELEEAIVANGDMDCLDFLRVASLIEAQPTVESVPNKQMIVKETINDNAYLHSCSCPECGGYISRGPEERTFYCENCGAHLHQRAFSQEEIEKACFEREMDEYED